MMYILYGEDPSRILQKLETIKRKNKIDTLITLDANTDLPQDVYNEIDSVSIFEENKMVVLDHCSFLSAKNTTNFEIEAFLRRVDDLSCILVLIHRGNKLDQRKKKVKELMGHSTVISCIALDTKSQRSFIHEQLQKIQLTMDPDAYSWFCSHVGLDALRISSELEKLKTYSNHIHLQDVKALVTPEPVDDVFKMVDALFQKNSIRLLAFYRNFRQQNMEPLAILGLMASQVRFLFQVHICMDQGMPQEKIASILKAHPYRIKVNCEKASSFSSDELLEMLSTLADLDQAMKMGKIDKDEGFESFILKM